MPDNQGVPVDCGWAWVIVIGYFIGIFCMVGIAKSFGILLVQFVDYFDIPVAIAALIMGVSGGVYTLAAPVCVAAGQHFTQRRVVMIGGLIGALGLSLSGFLFSIEWVIFTFGALYGFGNACLFGNGLVIIGQYFNKRRGLANGLSLSGASLGQFAIPPLLQFLLDTYSLKGTLIIIGGMYLNVIMCGALFRPTSFYSKRHTIVDSSKEQEKLLNKQEDWKANQIVKPAEPKDEEAAEYHLKSSGEGLFETVRYRASSTGSVVIGSVDSLHSLALDTDNQSKNKMADNEENNSKNKCIQFLSGLLDFSVLRSFVVILFILVSFLLFFGHFNFILFMPPTAGSRGVSKYDTAYLVSITGICDLFGRVLVGVAGDLQFIARYKLMGLATLLCGFSIFGFNLAQEYWLMAVFVGCYGFLGGCYVSINAPVLIDLVGLKLMPKVLGLVVFIQGLGAAVGQPVLGAIRDHLGSYEVVNYICCCSMVAGAVLLCLYPLVKKVQERREATLTAYTKEVVLTVDS
ncbi:monocarboxylate transporter 7-like [Mercenaria mercenaria]|uniref:monocarboxylate transporter 7-like n=1 Tax=Mercenaria mercenaria TaxID=6596 RepID=UPI00234F5434|nr:monocarboxylate transporter 7-like [Mercenaria mercenaria]